MLPPDEKPLALPLDGDHWIRWTKGLTLEEQGLCLRLLWMQWRDGAIPNDLDVLHDLTGASLPLLTQVIKAKFTSDVRGGALRLDSDELFAPEFEAQRQEGLARRKARSGAASIAGQARWAQDEARRQPKLELEVGEDPDFEAFLTAWGVYPKRAAANPRKPGWRAYKQRRRDGVAVDVLYDGTLRYRRYCDDLPVGPQFVMQGKRFYGPDEMYLHAWDIPNKPGRPPTSDDHRARVLKGLG